MNENTKKYVNQTLAVKYRPKTFEDLVEQDYIKAILLNQLGTQTTKQAYLFCGPAGDGKTTSARIFANAINSNKGKPVEIDAASNNSVDDVRQIIEDSKRKSLDSDYKVFIIDEVHMLSTGAWNAMLKLLEEPPKTAIFIMCTTDPQKIPATILSRVQRYNFSKISIDGIVNRLKFICDEENAVRGRRDKINYDQKALYYIASYADGGMRDAITMLDKSLSLSNTIDLDVVLKALGNVDMTINSNLLHNLTDNQYTEDHSLKQCLHIIEEVYDSGKDLKLFLKQFQYFMLDVLKIQLFGTFIGTKLPETNDMKKFVADVDFNKCADVLDFIIQLNANIKWESNVKEYTQCCIIMYFKKLEMGVE